MPVSKKKVDRIHVSQDVGKRECQILFPRGVNFNIYMEISSLYSLTSRQQSRVWIFQYFEYISGLNSLLTLLDSKDIALTKNINHFFS